MPFAALMVSGIARGRRVGYKKNQQCRKAIDIATRTGEEFPNIVTVAFACLA